MFSVLFLILFFTSSIALHFFSHCFSLSRESSRLLFTFLAWRFELGEVHKLPHNLDMNDEAMGWESGWAQDDRSSSWYEQRLPARPLCTVHT
jgi:hypothetical protein